MKNLKKLIPALCLLLISAMLLGTSTFAWFTMNTTVTASNLAVKATTGGNLLIALPDNGNAPAVSKFATSIDFDMIGAAEELPPVSTVNLSNWFKTTAATVGSTKKADNTAYAVAAEGEYLDETFYLYAGSDMDIYTKTLTATIKDGDDDKSVLLDGNNPLWNSLRIGIKVGDSFCIYALTAATANGQYGTEATAGTDATAVGVAGSDAASAAETLINKDSAKIFHAISATDADNQAYKLCSLTKNEVTEAQVYIWFEGTDGACFTNNYQDLDVTIGFTLAQLSATA